MAAAGDDWKGHLRSSFFVKIISVINIVSGNNYWITATWLSLLTFFASWRMFSVVCQYYPQARIEAAISFLFMPSVLFWSAGIIKESAALAGLMVIAATWLRAMKGERPSVAEVLLDVAGLWVLWHLKYYWAAVFIPVAVAALAVEYIRRRYPAAVKHPVILWLLLMPVLCLLASTLHPNFDLYHFLTVLVQNHNAFLPISDPANLIHYYNLTADWSSVGINAPWALCSGLLRPFLWEAHNIPGVMTGIENLLILILLVSTFRPRKNVAASDSLLSVSVIGYSVILCVFLALSTPNLGSLARYKVGFTPFLIFIILTGSPWVSQACRKLKKE